MNCEYAKVNIVPLTCFLLSFSLLFLMFYYGTVMQTGMAYKKIPCLTRTAQLAGSVLLKMLKYFEVMLNIFGISRVRNCRVLIGLRRKVFMNHTIVFLDLDNEANLVLATFSCF